ncbi:hypothetical protein HJC23_005381 [Cyclotella cryptica]|uniref:Uncharacterized protein n=1 Tax=Cyclotella cryptica TaxID=29204 RepID=A0ABD3P2Y2_9STRA|eukprot:CCRYP_018090-RB/>CCRYP_018090-RB protein AED:0.13 eAED:0.13 QI:267/-1/1/1/-1/1/1/824/841
MSSGYGRASGGGNGPTTNRKRNNKKFGLNLSQLTKPPAAPPVPSIIATGQSSSGGTSKSPANGLLLLSKKSQSSGGGLLAPAGGGAAPGASGSSKQTAHDALLLSAQGGAAAVDGQSGGEDNGGGKATAWGIAAEKQQSELKPQTSVESIMGELTLEATGQTSIQPRGEVESISVKNDEKSSTLVLAPRGSLAKQRSTVSALSDSASAPKNNADDMKAAPTEEKATDAPRKNEQQQLMSKLAKDRAQQLKSEEDARISHQNERAAKRLKELELKRLEQKKERERQHQQKLQRHQKKQQRFEGPPSSIVIGKDTPSMKRSPTITSPNVPSKIYSRKEVSQPSIVLEPLGKPKTIMTHSDKPHTNKNEIIDPQNDGKKKLYDPKRPFSSLVGGKPKHNPETLAGCGSVKSNKSEESSAAKDSRSSVGKASPALKSYNNNDESPPTSVRMVNLNSFEDRYRGVGRGPSSGSGPRMLFDPTSGSLVAAPSGDSSQQHHHQQQHTSLPGAKGNIKKTKPAQQQLSQKTVSGTGKHVDNSTKFSSRRQEGDPAKQKQVLQHKKEKNITGNSRSPPKSTRMKFPRTCGVLFRMDERGNYVNADECEADCGYGQHSVPGGRVKNHDAYAKLIEQNQQSTQGNSPQKASNKLNADAPSFMGFRKDPNFIQQQTDFEAQQQRILEDAWLSLVEAEPSREEEQNEEVPLPSQSHSDKDICNGGDEYAAALAISPTMFGLGFDKEEPIDISKFALEGDAIGLMPTNRFSSLGTGGSRLLGSSTWGVGNTTPPADTTLSGLAGISGWNFESSNTNETEPSKASNTFINLNGWGSSGLDSFAFGGSYKDSSKGSG